MLNVINFPFPKFELDYILVERETVLLADRLAEVMVAQNQIALLAAGKKVSGDTLQSISWDSLTNTPALQVRRVTGDAGYKFIRDGRKAGKPMPIHVVGATKTGRLLYEPLQPMLRWFQILGIPKKFWFPIMRRISIKGIKPVDIPNRAVKNALPAIKRQAKYTGAVITRGIVKRIG